MLYLDQILMMCKGQIHQRGLYLKRRSEGFKILDIKRLDHLGFDHSLDLHNSNAEQYNVLHLLV